jgi:hypothetical protein
MEAAKAKKVAVAAAAGAAMTTKLTPMRAERAMRYAHLCGRFAEVFATHVWGFKPLHPAAWDDTTVRLVIDKGTLVSGEDEWSADGDGALNDNRALALAVFTALALGAQACGAHEVALSLYEQARSHLALLFDTCDIRVAEALIALQYAPRPVCSVCVCVSACHNETDVRVFSAWRQISGIWVRRSGSCGLLQHDRALHFQPVEGAQQLLPPGSIFESCAFMWRLC